MDSLGDRIKRYEGCFDNTVIPRMPVIIRVDGRAFHTFTKHIDKPFDRGFMLGMSMAAYDVAKEMQGFKVAYIQSDEVTFCLTDYDTLTTQGWFGYRVSKMISISAALMSVTFNRMYALGTSTNRPVFDSRAFSVPIDDVVNTFLWRAKDWRRNSIQMYAQHFFSHKELHKQNQENMLNMLNSIGKDWNTDLNNMERNGTFLILKDGEIQIRYDILPNFQSINDGIGDLFIPK